MNNCRVKRNRVAPSAPRKAISFSRAAVRANIRFATFAHAISSTNPTAPSSTHKGARISPVNISFSGITLTPAPVFSCG